MRDGGDEGMALADEPLLGAAGVAVVDGAFGGNPTSVWGFSGFNPSGVRQSDTRGANDGCACGCEENWYEIKEGLSAGASNDGGDSAAPGCEGVNKPGGCKAGGN
jgi:hypothetical protein